MANTFWQKQAPDKPLFADLIWSRPENKRQAGKLLVIGGNKHGFAAPAAAFQAAAKAGIGTSRVLLPDSLKRTVGTSFIEADFAPSTPSGSFAKTALAQFLEHADWADGVILAGDFGRNSETAILLGSFVDKYSGLLAVAGDSLDYFLHGNSPVLNRENTLLVINLGKLQKLAKNNNPQILIKHADGLLELANKLSDWSQTANTFFITKHADNLLAAVSGQVSYTPEAAESHWQIELAAYGATWLIQQSQKPFEALTSAVFSYLGPKK